AYFTFLKEIKSCSVKNGGCDHNCVHNQEGEIVCSCRPGWKLDGDGRHCTDIDECALVSRGNCQQRCLNVPGSWECGCYDGYRRRNDSLFTCQPVCGAECLNNGVCVAPNRCYCPPGYPGPECTPLCSPSCAHGGRCKRFNLCVCPTGWVGAACKTAVCTPPCANGGRCVAPNQCECTHLYTGSYCQTPTCFPACQNAGICVAANRCFCRRNWSGPRCGTRSSLPFVCNPPCRNNGTCVASNRCVCQPTYRGSRCEKEKPAEKCRPPCRNGGTCGRGNRCQCPQGTQGFRCQRLICPRVTLRVPYNRQIRRSFRESYLAPCGKKVCTRWRMNQRRVVLPSYKIEYRIQC
uniref:EGF-like domain-containing protein n=1 Tax=Ciona savignyi TaxID=51511 RepID=H2YES2_CIOSA